jgi:hypothetical protein
LTGGFSPSKGYARKALRVPTQSPPLRSMAGAIETAGWRFVMPGVLLASYRAAPPELLIMERRSGAACRIDATKQR